MAGGSQCVTAEPISAYRHAIRRLTQGISKARATSVYVAQRWSTFSEKIAIVCGAALKFILESAFNDIVGEICRKIGAICTDLGSVLYIGSGAFFDPIHSAPKGSKKIGQYACRK